MARLARVSDLSMQMIGRDHQEIAEILVEIKLNTNRDGDLAERVRRMKDLVRLQRSHFMLEEGLMAAVDYPHLALHALRHKWMLDQMRRSIADLNHVADALVHEPVGILWESHNTHSESEDRAFGVWINEGSKSILVPGRAMAAAGRQR
jgi:hemerythrin-like metal-binding protein